ncbi:hypothetical protein G837_03906 [Escherichia coli HVH 185 (4-2876639)]|nr:hypothetical protein G837_03906 [Escherichia coli HVH 185 (4-2876639)]EQV60432.1 hypothetical protein G888_04737 [Escherichia coli KOEGE 58 (171a)]EQW63368.1 hypothetical protein G909_03855 [Escherichia coli UMEA 3113-1]STI93377.1 CP4-57 prophage protein [Escherichia coli]EQV64815.1 hypothetical protein G888_03780 [Escherichia coli KOEGE 58 (171a)]
MYPSTGHYSQPNLPALTSTIQAIKRISPYPTDTLPPVLGNVIRSLHNSTGIPTELIGNVVLATVSLTCQSLVDVIQPHTDMPEPCSLYLMTVAESGEGKTTINKLVMKPCYEFAASLIQQYQTQNNDYKNQLNIWKIRQRVLEGNFRQAIKKRCSGKDEREEIHQHFLSRPQRPPYPNFIYEDTSLKALVEGLSDYPWAGMISDEAIIFFKSHLKNNPGLLSKAWDGEIIDFRRADGECYHFIPHLTFSLMPQPGVFSEYIRKNTVSARESGFLSRFLFVCPDRNSAECLNTGTGAYTDYNLNVFHKRINELLDRHNNLNSGTEIRKKTLRLSDEAIADWQENHAVIQRMISPGGEWEHIRDIALKASANILRLSALFNYVHDDREDAIHSHSLKAVIYLVNWYLGQAEKLFYPMSERYQFENDVRRLYAYIFDKVNQNNGYPFPKNHLEKYGPHSLRRAEKLTPVLNQLIKQRLVCVIQIYPSRALYVALCNQNGIIIAPYNVHYTVIQSQENTWGRPYDVTIL